jgi:hypothetical protein
VRKARIEARKFIFVSNSSSFFLRRVLALCKYQLVVCVNPFAPAKQPECDPQSHPPAHLFGAQAEGVSEAFSVNAQPEAASWHTASFTHIKRRKRLRNHVFRANTTQELT